MIFKCSLKSLTHWLANQCNLLTKSQAVYADNKVSFRCTHVSLHQAAWRLHMFSKSSGENKQVYLVGIITDFWNSLKFTMVLQLSNFSLLNWPPNLIELVYTKTTYCIDKPELMGTEETIVKLFSTVLSNYLISHL